MGDEAAAKKKRSLALSKFTRSVNTFTSLLDGVSPKSLVEPQYDLVKTCWSALEEAQEEFLEITVDIDAAGGVVDYLDEPEVRHTDALKAYAAYLKAVDDTELAAARQLAQEASLLENEKRKHEVYQRLMEEQAKAKD